MRRLLVGLSLLAGPACTTSPAPLPAPTVTPAGTSTQAAAGSAVASSSSTASAPAVALVELFTSEGCSSCPPADDELAALAEEDARIVTVAFHVDYWDEGGWKDPFAQAAFTDRQHVYAEALGGGLYTPEMVVNGAVGFTGSDASRARREVRGALATPSEVPLTIHADTGGNVIRVRWSAPGMPRDALLAVAIIERRRTVVVTAGENRAKTLRHTNVARALEVTNPRAEEGTQTVTVPADVAQSNVAVVAWAASGASLRVLGAASSTP